MKYRPTFALSLLVLTLSACSSTPTNPTKILAKPNLPLADSYPLSVSDTLPSAASVGWRQFYSDPKLQALIETGLLNNKTLEQATLAIDKAAAQYQISHRAALPQIGASGSYTRSGNKDASQGNYSVGLGLSSYEIDFWGRIGALKEQALQSYLATSAAKDTAQISLIANIAQAYLAVSYAKADILLAQSTIQSREHSLYIAEQRFKAGIDSKTPSLQAEASLENAKLALLGSQKSLIKAQNALQLLTGSPIIDELLPEPAVTALIQEPLLNAGLPSELLYHRPDIVIAEHQLKAAGANIDVARAAFFPSIHLSGNLGLASTDLTNLFNTNTLSWSFAPSINLPIFDAGARKANLEVAQIEQKQALANYESAIQTAFREVNDVLANKATLDDELAIQYRLQQNYQQTYDIAYATFRTGLSNYLDVLDAERSLFAIQQNILQLERQKVASQIELYQVLGGGATPNTKPVIDTPARLATAQEMADLSKPSGVNPLANTSNEPAQILPTANHALVIDKNLTDTKAIDNTDNTINNGAETLQDTKSLTVESDKTPIIQSQTAN